MDFVNIMGFSNFVLIFVRWFIKIKIEINIMVIFVFLFFFYIKMNKMGMFLLVS